MVKVNSINQAETLSFHRDLHFCYKNWQWNFSSKRTVYHF